MGPENYSRIFDAFTKHGWAGFEEKSDRTVRLDHPDHADLKRDLLRKPTFRIKAHWNLAEALLGRKTMDEILVVGQFGFSTQPLWQADCTRSVGWPATPL